MLKQIRYNFCFGTINTTASCRWRRLGQDGGLFESKARVKTLLAEGNEVKNVIPAKSDLTMDVPSFIPPSQWNGGIR